MKRLLPFSSLIISNAVFAFQNNPPVPIEESRPINFWRWIIGVVISIGLGILLYFLIKKDPKKDVP